MTTAKTTSFRVVIKQGRRFDSAQGDHFSELIATKLSGRLEPNRKQKAYEVAKRDRAQGDNCQCVFARYIMHITGHDRACSHAQTSCQTAYAEDAGQRDQRKDLGGSGGEEDLLAAERNAENERIEEKRG